MTLLRRFPLPPSRSVALARSLDLFLVLRLGRFRRVSTPQQLRTKSLCLGAGALHSHALLAGHAGLQAGHSAGHMHGHSHTQLQTCNSRAPPHSRHLSRHKGKNKGLCVQQHNRVNFTTCTLAVRQLTARRCHHQVFL
jgi:hypothetical protein|uniref:Uncharacterized protein n=1 Tax=Zea mays TaxID=4577 RepID=C0PIP9_MAIZE|nr:unknown [Zea mays]